MSETLNHWWIFAFIALLTFSFLWSVFYIRLIMQKRHAELMSRAYESEQKALRAQMTPHFIFNSLNSIQQLISVGESDEAVKNMSRFSRLMRRILENSKLTKVPLVEELEVLKLYMDLECLRFDHKFQYQINVSDDLDIDEVEIPPMLIQPYIENAIWHGLMNKKSDDGRLEVGIEEVDDMLICSVSDNGIGREEAAKISGQRLEHKSTGMEITQERLKIINTMQGSNMSVHIIDLKDAAMKACGTRVEVFIPLNH